MFKALVGSQSDEDRLKIAYANGIINDKNQLTREGRNFQIFLDQIGLKAPWSNK